MGFLSLLPLHVTGFFSFPSNEITESVFLLPPVSFLSFISSAPTSYFYRLPFLLNLDGKGFLYLLVFICCFFVVVVVVVFLLNLSF